MITSVVIFAAVICTYAWCFGVPSSAEKTAQRIGEWSASAGGKKLNHD
jgi:hypothetical protein